MGTLADSLFAVLMSWVRALVSGIWALFSSEHTTVLEFLGKNWMMIAVVMIAAGLVIDWLIWLLRWQPYHIWAQRVRRLLRMERGEEDEQEEDAYQAHAAMAPEDRSVYARPQEDESYQEGEETKEAFTSGSDLFIDARQEQEAIERAEAVPDESLGAYPGMRYGASSQQTDMGHTQRYSVLNAEGPGSAEVARRRAEIDAWQKQMQEEARARAQAERAQREEQERLAREAEEAARLEEEKRLALEAEAARRAHEERLAREAEAARREEEERLAREAEQARLMQEEYERQLEEYARQREQYERDLAEYERRKAEYDAQMESLERAQREKDAQHETSKELEPAVTAAPLRRRRAAQKAYSDYVSGEDVTELPDPPSWPSPTAKKTAKTGKPKMPKKTAARDESAKKEKPAKEHKLLSCVAKMMDPQEEELSNFTSLPPRVDMHDAYKPAKKPDGRNR